MNQYVDVDEAYPMYVYPIEAKITIRTLYVEIWQRRGYPWAIRL